ncbi:hypothetical protein FRB97_003754 [Tulasnella sp. 331]|nr:hypothetical protein FRB97_003754 [Tulasnella sp. 331]
MDALPINPSTQPYTLGHGLHAAGANWTSLTNPYPLCANSDSRASSPSTSKHAGHFPPSVNTASSSSLTRLRSEPERLLTTRKRYQSPPESEPVAAPRRRTVDEISDTVYEVPTDDNDSDRRPVYPVHVHVVNVLCPHPECWAPSVVEEPGASPSRVYHCAYVDPRTGVACASDFKRRGCIDRHASSHSGRESKAVASGYLTPALARRLIWETINLVETSNWSCLQTTLTSSINLEEDEKAAKRAVEAEFDLKVLREQTAAIRAQIIRYGDEERAHPQSGPYNPINAVDLSNASQFSRLMIKRASTFERYYCSHRRCDADFTRVDALIRHERSCHKSKAGTNSAARAEAGPLGRGDSGPVQRQSAEAEDDWISSTSS